MQQFTLEFLPHFAGAIKRKADFSLYEVKWNNYGRWGLFELQINIPTQVKFVREIVSANTRTILLNDLSVSNTSGEWTEKRLALYERFKGQTLTKLPDDLQTSPQEWLLLRLMLTFSTEDRLRIADILNFKYGNHLSPDIVSAFLNDSPVINVIKKYSGHIKL